MLICAMFFVTIAPFLNVHFGLQNHFVLFKFNALVLFVLAAGFYSMSLEFFKRQTVWILSALIFYIFFQIFNSLSNGSSLFSVLPIAFSSSAFALLY